MLTRSRYTIWISNSVLARIRKVEVKNRKFNFLHRKFTQRVNHKQSRQILSNNLKSVTFFINCFKANREA